MSKHSRRTPHRLDSSSQDVLDKDGRQTLVVTGSSFDETLTVFVGITPCKTELVSPSCLRALAPAMEVGLVLGLWDHYVPCAHTPPPASCRPRPSRLCFRLCAQTVSS